MRSRIAVKRRVGRLAALLMLALLAGLVPTALADDDGDDDGGGTPVVFTEPVSQVCMPPDDQVCDPRHQVAFSGEADRVTFDVSPAHCSSIKVELFVNGVSQDESPFFTFVGGPPGPTSFTWVVDLDPGDDIELQATGRPGGCNAGTLISWGGTLTFVDEVGGDDDDNGDDDDGDDDDGGDG
jgi:hypothetical protein